jgi:hypothetical protein
VHLVDAIPEVLEAALEDAETPLRSIVGPLVI